MIKYVIYQNLNEKNTAAYKRYYARAVAEETMDLVALAKHMAEHNSGYSEAQCIGVITAMRKCIKEQVLEGKNVKIDDLCIFSCGLKCRGGADTEEEFSTKMHVAGVKLRCRATGELSNHNLSLDATLKKATALTTIKADSEAKPGTPGE